jgi:hypothetical protein
MLVTPGKKLDDNYCEWLAVGFQSHELVLPDLEISEGAHTIHWKIALPPSRGIEKFTPCGTLSDTPSLRSSC